MNTVVDIYAENLIHNFGLPQYETQGASGMDIRANEHTVIRPGETKLIKTGLFMAIPDGFEIQVRPRSGLSLKSPFRVANAPGTVDADYRGEVCIIGTNLSNSEDFNILVGDRIAQIVLQEVPKIEWRVVDSRAALLATSRGEGGFGSTGK